MTILFIKMPALSQVANPAALNMSEWEAMGRLCASIENEHHGAREVNRRLQRGGWKEGEAPYIFRDAVESYVKDKLMKEGFEVRDWFVSANIIPDPTTPRYGWEVKLWFWRRTKVSETPTHAPTISGKTDLNLVRDKSGLGVPGCMTCKDRRFIRVDLVHGKSSEPCPDCYDALDPDDIEITYFGSDNVAEDNNGVRLEHRPTGVRVRASEHRSRFKNMSQALDLLRRTVEAKENADLLEPMDEVMEKLRTRGPLTNEEIEALKGVPIEQLPFLGWCAYVGPNDKLCGARQHQTPGGPSCVGMGHGGADTLDHDPLGDCEACAQDIEWVDAHTCGIEKNTGEVDFETKDRGEFPPDRMSEAQARSVLREYPDADLSGVTIEGGKSAHELAVEEGEKTIADLNLRYGDTLKGNLNCTHKGHSHSGGHCSNCGTPVDDALAAQVAKDRKNRTAWLDAGAVAPEGHPTMRDIPGPLADASSPGICETPARIEDVSDDRGEEGWHVVEQVGVGACVWPLSDSDASGVNFSADPKDFDSFEEAVKWAKEQVG